VCGVLLLTDEIVNNIYNYQHKTPDFGVGSISSEQRLRREICDLDPSTLAVGVRGGRSLTPPSSTTGVRHIERKKDILALWTFKK